MNRSIFDKDFYEKMLEVHTDVKHVRLWINNHEVEDKQKHEVINKRINSLENDRAKVIGAAAIVSFIAGLLTKFFHK